MYVSGSDILDFSKRCLSDAFISETFLLPGRRNGFAWKYRDAEHHLYPPGITDMPAATGLRRTYAMAVRRYSAESISFKEMSASLSGSLSLYLLPIQELRSLLYSLMKSVQPASVPLAIKCT